MKNLENSKSLKRDLQFMIKNINFISNVDNDDNGSRLQNLDHFNLKLLRTLFIVIING